MVRSLYLLASPAMSTWAEKLLRLLRNGKTFDQLPEQDVEEMLEVRRGGRHCVLLCWSQLWQPIVICSQ